MGIVVATRLSYTEDFINYIVAYNIGIVLFLVAMKTRFNNEVLNKFSELGFAFFLGAGLPMSIVRCYFDFSVNVWTEVLGWIIKFVLATVFSVVLCRYVEKPLLSRAKKIEQKML